MKRIKWFAILALVVALLLSATPVYAHGGPPPPQGDAETEVVLSDITLSGDGIYYVSDTVTASGTVTIISTADAWGSTSAQARATSEAGFVVVGPDGLIDNGGNSESDSDSGHPQQGHPGHHGYVPADTTADANAGQTYSWESTFVLTEEGDYIISQGGEADAKWKTTGSWHYSDDEGSNQITITALPPPEEEPPESVNGPEYVEYNPISGCEGQFSVVLGYFVAYKTVDWTKPMSMVTSKQLVVSGQLGNTVYQVIVPAGTKVTPGWGVYMPALFIDDVGGLKFTPSDATFSNPITINKFVNGTWVKVVEFTKLVSGTPVL